MLESFLRQNPNDALARYGLGMEYAAQGQAEPALEAFRAVIAAHPDYSAAYQQAGQLLSTLGRHAEARDFFVKGIEAAHRQGNAHAAAEMQGLLDELPG
jgi:tetratricopeptide (TPR) repeat protein